ncbi:phosphonate ABC transporter, permease protein PhnE [Oceanobacillus profundus]|uniref:Phosphonate ABC transporter, permease protein PhnE n=1 Tax=Oceanobacillus profundus TaxID=372463 RepID=A0A417YEE3_9BACI|nr:phosphonate ABC transporter, permease protein PhnE [Oceanobacillus profundus]MBR3118439.1 phosphonate ABC transporter, permease protein PhnE [Oceanobacillus sp.]MCM3399051.1 phosphonate ABC transporter, permease protein PhnE [Oceanobacillus profundus]MDO6450589.1 phosphonate ABC transporter, permease protein PhnE [Oceanobacillus profundus]RHW30977.1 phosphonate ABC transporter, permease protein PhnE [Oceanobacillus profundus]
MTNENNSVTTKKVPSIYPAKTKIQVTVIFFVVLGIYLFSMTWTQQQMVGGFSGAFQNVFQVIEKFFPPNTAVISAIWGPMVETIQMAIIATTVAAILTVPLALLAAQNVTTFKPLYYITRTFLNLLRTIPDLVLAVIFVGLFGIGLFPGILALIIFSLGILAKLISETIESVDMNPLEAMRASGGNVLQVIWYALIPQVLPQFTSLVLYVFEINIRASVVLGLVGAGGIGLILNQQLGFYNYPNAMMIIILIFVVVIVIEYISTKIREALL